MSTDRTRKVCRYDGCDGSYAVEEFDYEFCSGFCGAMWALQILADSHTTQDD